MTKKQLLAQLKKSNTNYINLLNHLNNETDKNLFSDLNILVYLQDQISQQIHGMLVTYFDVDYVNAADPD